MKRRILLVDDDVAVLLTLKAVLDLHGFEVETAGSASEAIIRIESGIYQMVISDLHMGSEEAGLDVIRSARRQPYDPATALLTAYPASGMSRDRKSGGEEGKNNEDESVGEDSDSLLIKPLGTGDLLRQIEALLIRHAERQAKKQLRRDSA